VGEGETYSIKRWKKEKNCPTDRPGDKCGEKKLGLGAGDMPGRQEKVGFETPTTHQTKREEESPS